MLTIAANWDATIPAIGVSDYLVRAGDAASGGTATVLMGMAGWIVGGASPGTLFGLSRNTDPVRLSGQAYTATNVPLEEAAQEMSALVAQQGAKTPKRMWVHTRDFANMKKALGTKVTYTRASVASTLDATVGFSGYEIDGDDGTIVVMTSPSKGSSSVAALYCAKNDMLRVSGDDAFEARFVSYLNHYTNNPVSCIKATGFGA